MAREKFTFDVVSPEKMLLSQEAEMVVVPGIDGDIGVLKGHAPVLTSLRTGTIAIFEGDKVVARLFVNGGFAEINANSCTILAEHADNFTDLDVQKCRQMLSDAKDEISVARDDDEKTHAIKKQNLAEAQISALENLVY